MRSIYKLPIALAVAAAWLVGAQTQQALLLHVAVAHTAPHDQSAEEPTRGHQEVAVQHADHSHCLALDLAAVTRSGNPHRTLQATSADLLPCFVAVGVYAGPIVPDLEHHASPHPLERHPSLRL